MKLCVIFERHKQELCEFINLNYPEQIYIFMYEHIFNQKVQISSHYV